MELFPELHKLVLVQEGVLDEVVPTKVLMLRVRRDGLGLRKRQRSEKKVKLKKRFIK